MSHVINNPPCISAHYILFKVTDWFKVHGFDSDSWFNNNTMHGKTISGHR
jgi:hypothetical protein